MTYLDFERLRTFSADEFRNARPYPWLNPEGALTDEGYRRLIATLPATDVMQPFFGVKRKHGQEPHDRWVLEYNGKAVLSDDWQAFIEELRSPRYINGSRRCSAAAVCG